MFSFNTSSFKIRFLVFSQNSAYSHLQHTQLENVAIANALQLEAARRRAVPIRFNFVARAKFELAQPIRCRLTAFLLGSPTLVGRLKLYCCILSFFLPFLPEHGAQKPRRGRPANVYQRFGHKCRYYL